MLKIVPEGEKSFQESRRVWSLAFMGDLPYATIYAEWPLLPKEPYEVSIAIVLGEWGAGASPSDRFWIFVVYRSASESGFMIVDPPDRSKRYSALATRALSRDEVLANSEVKNS